MEIDCKKSGSHYNEFETNLKKICQDGIYLPDLARHSIRHATAWKLTAKKGGTHYNGFKTNWKNENSKNKCCNNKSIFE